MKKSASTSIKCKSQTAIARVQPLRFENRISENLTLSKHTKSNSPGGDIMDYAWTHGWDSIIAVVFSNNIARIISLRRCVYPRQYKLQLFVK